MATLSILEEICKYGVEETSKKLNLSIESLNVFKDVIDSNNIMISLIQYKDPDSSDIKNLKSWKLRGVNMKEEIERHYYNNRTLVYVANILGCSVTTVRYHATKHGLVSWRNR